MNARVARRAGASAVMLASAIALSACGGGGDDDGAVVPTRTAQQVQRVSDAQYRWAALTMAPCVELVDLDASPTSAAAISTFLANSQWAGRTIDPDVYVRGGSDAERERSARELVARGARYVYVIE